MTLSFVGTVDNYLKKKYTYLIANAFKSIKVYNVQKTFTVVFYPLRDSIPNIGLRALRSRSCTRWLFPAPKLSLFSFFFSPLSKWSIFCRTYTTCFCTALKATGVCKEHQSSPGHEVLQRRTMPMAQTYLLVSGTALPLACLITFLDVQYVCSDRKLSL